MCSGKADRESVSRRHRGDRGTWQFTKVAPAKQARLEKMFRSRLDTNGGILRSTPTITDTLLGSGLRSLFGHSYWIASDAHLSTLKMNPPTTSSSSASASIKEIIEHLYGAQVASDEAFLHEMLGQRTLEKWRQVYALDRAKRREKLSLAQMYMLGLKKEEAAFLVLNPSAKMEATLDLQAVELGVSVHKTTIQQRGKSVGYLYSVDVPILLKA